LSREVDLVPLNWVRVAWTVGIAALGFIVFFIYLEYDSEYQRRLSELGPIGAKAAAKAPAKTVPTSPAASKRRVPKRSRRYRLRR